MHANPRRRRRGFFLADGAVGERRDRSSSNDARRRGLRSFCANRLVRREIGPSMGGLREPRSSAASGHEQARASVPASPARIARRARRIFEMPFFMQFANVTRAVGAEVGAFGSGCRRAPTRTHRAWHRRPPRKKLRRNVDMHKKRD